MAHAICVERSAPSDHTVGLLDLGEVRPKVVVNGVDRT